MGEIPLAKHLAQAAARRAAKHRRHAIRLAVAGTAVVAAHAVGLHGSGSVLPSGEVAAQGPQAVSVTSRFGSTVVVAGRDAVPGAAAVSAPARAVLSYSRTEVLTKPKEVVRKLDAAQAQRRRPSAGTLRAPLEVLHRSSRYGLRKSPITGSAGEFHWGLDFAAACGTRVYSVDAGVVRAVGWHRWGGGNRVEVDHGNGLITTYNHLEGIAVRKGQSVQVGEVIAKVGTTGASTGCHLHFETVLNGRHTDPEKWTLLPLRQAEPFADMALTDYRKAGRTTDEPAWAVPVTESHHHEAADHEAETPKRTASKRKSSSPSAAVPAPAPAKPAPAPMAPAPVASAAPTPTPTRRAAPSSAPVPMPVPTQGTQESVKEPEREPEPTTVPATAKAVAAPEQSAAAPAASQSAAP